MTDNRQKTGAIILAAGFGSRLMPLTADRPKCMVSFSGRTLLDRQCAVFSSLGVDDIAIVTGHAGSAVPAEGFALFNNPDYETTNMLHSLMCARTWLEEDKDVIISYGDIIFTPQVLHAVLDAPHDIAVCIDTGWKKYWQTRMEDPLADAETMKYGAKGEIVELGKKPESYDDIQGQYIGLQKWKASAVKDILNFYDHMDRMVLYDGKPFRQMFMTSFIQALIDSGRTVMPVPVKHGWLEFDTIEDMQRYERMAATGELKTLYDDAA